MYTHKYNYITNKTTIDEEPAYDVTRKVADIAKIYEDKYWEVLNSECDY